MQPPSYFDIYDCCVFSNTTSILVEVCVCTAWGSIWSVRVGSELNSPCRASCVGGEVWRPLNSLKQKRISPVEEERSGIELVEMAVEGAAVEGAAMEGAAVEGAAVEGAKVAGRETRTVVGDRLGTNGGLFELVRRWVPAVDSGDDWVTTTSSDESSFSLVEDKLDSEEARGAFASSFVMISAGVKVVAALAALALAAAVAAAAVAASAGDSAAVGAAAVGLSSSVGVVATVMGYGGETTDVVEVISVTCESSKWGKVEGSTSTRRIVGPTM